MVPGHGESQYVDDNEVDVHEGDVRQHSDAGVQYCECEELYERVQRHELERGQRSYQRAPAFPDQLNHAFYSLLAAASERRCYRSLNTF